MEKITQAIPMLNSWVDSWKSDGKKVLGYFCSYIPEEIIYAADILPVRIRARGCTDTPMGDAYLTPTSCSFTRCVLDMASRNEYKFLDGIISCNCCDQVRRLYDNIRYKAPFPFHYIISVPGYTSKVTLDWFKHELNKFIAVLEKNFKVTITEDKLKNAIKIYNESRRLLKELYILRKNDNPPVNGTDIINILSTAVSIPKKPFNALLSEYLKEIKEKSGILNIKARIMLIGSMLDDPEFTKIIEDLGGLVITDSNCLGTRYFWDLIDETKNPIDALAEHYLSKISCPRMTDGKEKRAEFMMELIKEYNIDGIIFQRLKFCALWWAEIFMLRDILKKKEIPVLELEREYSLSGVGAVKTRVQAFMEILEER